MSQQLSSEISLRIAAWLAANGPNDKAGAAALTQAYKQGANSSAISLAAYLTTRMPATYAAIYAVLKQAQGVEHSFQPNSLLDIGAGPGTASFAAKAMWPSLQSIVMIEQDARFANLAKYLSPEAQVLHEPLQNMLSLIHI